MVSGSAIGPEASASNTAAATGAAFAPPKPDCSNTTAIAYFTSVGPRAGPKPANSVVSAFETPCASLTSVVPVLPATGQLDRSKSTPRNTSWNELNAVPR